MQSYKGGEMTESRWTKHSALASKVVHTEQRTDSSNTGVYQRPENSPGD
jgi:hypothetical protein